MAAVNLRGRLLVAEPTLRDPNFVRTVVFVLEYDESTGALGVVLNRPSGIRVGDAVPTWAPYVSGVQEIFTGGPVMPEGAICLVAPDSVCDDTVTLVTPDIGVLDLHADPSDVHVSLRAMRIFGGYAGWEAGQLDAELDAGGWYVLDAQTSDVFDDQSPTLWRRVLQRQPGELRARAFFPEDPALN